MILPDDRKSLYCGALDDLTETQLRHGFALALRHLGEFLPSVQQIRTWAESWRPPEPEARELRKSHLLTVGQKLGISSEQIQDWLAAGKEAQQEHIAKLEEDPEWREMADRLGARPGLTRRESSVPNEPEERQEWARENARRNGWSA